MWLFDWVWKSECYEAFLMECQLSLDLTDSGSSSMWIGEHHMPMHEQWILGPSLLLSRAWE